MGVSHQIVLAAPIVEVWDVARTNAIIRGYSGHVEFIIPAVSVRWPNADQSPPIARGNYTTKMIKYSEIHW